MMKDVMQILSPGLLDPICGIGKTPTQAKKLDRSYIGIDLNPDYVEEARNNLRETRDLYIFVKE